MVRVNREDGRAKAVPQDALQQKGDRDYFRAGLLLKPGEVHLSEINLNQEQGKVELPHRRTLRAAAPITTPGGEWFGMVVVNMDIGPALDLFHESLPKGVRTYLVNEAGDYLVHPHPERTFGFDLGKRHRWQDDITAPPAGAETPAGAPERLQSLHLSGEALHGVQRVVHFDPQPPRRFMNLTYAFPEEVIRQDVAHAPEVAVATTLGLGAAIGLLLILYVRRALTPLQQLTKAAVEVGEGGYDVALPGKGRGEIGALTGAFRSMVTQIGARDREIRQVNAALAASEADASLIVDSVPEVILVVDANGCIVRANAQVETLFGYQPGELLGQPVEMLIPARLRAHHPALRQDYVNSFRRQVMGKGRELFGQHKDGRDIPVEAGLAPLASGEVHRVLVTIRDITERKAAKAEILRLNTGLELQVAERTTELRAANQELESFAYAIAHDLRAPVRATAGFSQALLEDHGEGLAPGARVYLDQIVLGARRMGDLVDGLLVLSRSTRGELRRDALDLSALAEGILAELARMDPGRRVTWDVEYGLLARGDGRMLEAVMRNLLDNAWKYTAGTPEARIRVHAEQINQERFFCVSDNGAGFDMAHAGKLFEPFQRLHRQEEFAGIGIGLATVQRIVRRHGCQILAQGVPGHGARFCFSLSVAAADPGETSKETST